LKNPTYGSYRAMIRRCVSPRCKDWIHYGAVGIKVDPHWLGECGFENFLADVGERPAGTSLGRFGDTGNYEPGNCAWQTPKQQAAEQKKKRLLHLVAA